MMLAFLPKGVGEMWNIRIRIRCYGFHSEVILDDLEGAELFLEQLVGLQFQEVLEAVIIDEVTVCHVPTGTLEDTTLPDCAC
jgi:hypothetical protein